MSNLEHDVNQLILRKLRYMKREQEKRFISSKQAVYSKLNKEIRASISSQSLERATITVPGEAYRELISSITNLTKEWPIEIWKTIETILIKSQTSNFNRTTLNTIVDQHAWKLGQEPYIVKYLNPEGFKDTVIRELRRIGLIQEKDLEACHKNIDLVAALGTMGIRNTGRESRVKVGIDIDEFLIEYQQNIPTHNTDINKNTATTALSNKSAPSKIDIKTPDTCLPNPPKKTDDWFLVIRDMALAFHIENNRCPNEAEAWSRLRECPPSSYGITPGKHHREPAIFMDGGALGKRSFSARWKRYTKRTTAQ